MNPLLESALQSLRNQTLQNYELVFVDNGSEKGSLDWVQEHAHTFIRMKNNDGAYLARNIGSLFARSSIMLFLEDDGIADERLLEAHYAAHLEFPQTVGIRGACLPIHIENNHHLRPIHYYYGWDILPYFPNLEGNSSFKSNFFYSINGWSDSIRFGHGGVEIMLRAMAKKIEYSHFLYIPTAILRHDYAKGTTHLESKKKLQETSKKMLLELYPDWNKSILKWQSAEIQTLTAKHADNEYKKKSLALLNEFKDVYERHKEGIQYLQNNRLLTLSSTEMTSLAQQTINKNVFIYGASLKGEFFYRFCQAYNIRINAFVDSNPEKHGQLFNYLPVIAPSSMPAESIVLIASTWAEDIYTSLKNKPEEFTLLIVTP